MRTLSIAALQVAPVPGDPGRTWKRFEELAHGVGRLFPGVQLLIAPEQYLSAPPPLSDEHVSYMQEVAVEIPGPLTQRLASLARDTGLWLVPGSLYERTSDGIYNTAIAVSPSGELVARYRKVFPWQPYEGCLPGRSFETFEIPGVGCLGLAICYDVAFPEAFRQLAWKGAEVIIQPTLTSTVDREQELVLARASAICNQVYVLSVNASAPAGLGRSAVVDPEGLVRYEAGATEQIITDVLDLDAVTRVRMLGSHGLNRVWAQLERHGGEIELPAYGGTFQRPPWASVDGSFGRAENAANSAPPTRLSARPDSVDVPISFSRRRQT